jgi:sucrose-6-phosphate hydrolase SacC (GH32 family)
MNIPVTAQYLLLPVEKNSPALRLTLSVGEKLLHEMELQLSKRSCCDFCAVVDVKDYQGQTLIIQGLPEELEGELSFQEEKPAYPAPAPKLHFAPPVGWMNDPNGLVCQDGVYHLFYQHNPYGVVWGNMHWGHTWSKDLIHWQQPEIALYPDDNGTIFSGSGVVDEKGIAGYGENALLFYYTAAGGKNQRDKEAGFTQRMAYSTDGGKTLVKSPAFCIPQIEGENRDPKVFYHKPSQGYIMVLYLDGHEFALLRSEDLQNWRELQRLSFRSMWECPDLFELNVRGTDEKKWVFWSADGYYVTGQFDGWKFRPESDVKTAYQGRLPYAAQTYSGTPGRTVMIPWLRQGHPHGNHCGVMGIPMELDLVRDSHGCHIAFTPVQEYQAMKAEGVQLTEEYVLSGKPVELVVTWPARVARGQTDIHVSGITISVDFDREIIRVTESASHAWKLDAEITVGQRMELHVVVDNEVLEIFNTNGTLYGAVEVSENALEQTIRMGGSAQRDVLPGSAMVYPVNV